MKPWWWLLGGLGSVENIFVVKSSLTRVDKSVRIIGLQVDSPFVEVIVNGSGSGTLVHTLFNHVQTGLSTPTPTLLHDIRYTPASTTLNQKDTRQIRRLEQARRLRMQKFTGEARSTGRPVPVRKVSPQDELMRKLLKRINWHAPVYYELDTIFRLSIMKDLYPPFERPAMSCDGRHGVRKAKALSRRSGRYIASIIIPHNNHTPPTYRRPTHPPKDEPADLEGKFKFLCQRYPHAQVIVVEFFNPVSVRLPDEPVADAYLDTLLA